MQHVLIEIGKAPASHFSDLMPGIISTLIGALVGFGPSYFFAWRASREFDRRAASDRLNANKTAARTAAFKLQRLVNSLYTIKGQIEMMVQESERDGIPHDQLWKVFLPFGGMAPEFVRFDVAEMMVVFDAGEARLANSMLLIADRQYAADTALQEYSQRRRAFHDFAASELAKGVAEAEIEGRSEPIVAELRGAAIHLRAIYPEDFDQAVVALKAFSEAMQRHFKDPTFLRMEVAEEDGGLS